MTWPLSFPAVDAAGMLREARGRTGWSQRQLAARTGIPQPTIARIESGAQAPRLDTVARLLAACGHELRSVPVLAGRDRAPLAGVAATVRTPPVVLRVVPAVDGHPSR
jgi:transcriptional regulator with XRE-family HTH domain